MRRESGIVCLVELAVELRLNPFRRLGTVEKTMIWRIDVERRLGLLPRRVRAELLLTAYGVPTRVIAKRLGVASTTVRRDRVRKRVAQTGLTSALLLMALTGCQAANAAAPVPCVTAPSPQAVYLPNAGDVLVNGMVDCKYANGTLSGCVLVPGATLDEFASSTLNGLGLDPEGNE